MVHCSSTISSELLAAAADVAHNMRGTCSTTLMCNGNVELYVWSYGMNHIMVQTGRSHSST